MKSITTKKSRTAAKGFLLLVILLNAFAFTSANINTGARGAEDTAFPTIERNVTRENLKLRVDTLLSEGSLPDVSIQASDGLFTIVSFPSDAVKESNLHCSEIYFDLRVANVYDLVTMHAPENPFIQSIIQPNKYYTVIRLRSQCGT